MANETAKPAVIAVKYCVRNVGLLNGLLLNNASERDLAFDTMLSSWDGGFSLLSGAALTGKTPRRGVPDKGRTLRCDLPFAAVVLSGASSLEKTDFDGRLFGMGRAG